MCGATNLGEALRRISEGAALIRSKGEAGTGNIVEAVRHLRSIMGDIRAITQADSAEVYAWAKHLGAPVELVQRGGGDRDGCRYRCSAPAASPRRPTPPSSCSSAPRPCSSGSGIFKSDDPARRARAIVEATTHFDDAQIVAKVSRGLGAAMPGLEMGTLETRLAERGW